ncbi:MAG: acyl carrier protein [Ruminococcaceae bacterium]|jgi:acyl carrier protein|nr:acyl carrier protein [Oscillospiraceae bacterium]
MVFETIQKLICEQFAVDPESITEKTNFLQDLSADSLDFVELVMNIEDAFSLPEISEEEIRSIQTVGDLVDFVRKTQE